MLGWICSSTTPYYDAKTGRNAFKQRPVLVISDGAYGIEAKYGVEWVATDSVLLVANEQVIKTPVSFPPF